MRIMIFSVFYCFVLLFNFGISHRASDANDDDNDADEKLTNSHPEDVEDEKDDEEEKEEKDDKEENEDKEEKEEKEEKIDKVEEEEKEENKDKVEEGEKEENDEIEDTIKETKTTAPVDKDDNDADNTKINSKEDPELVEDEIGGGIEKLKNQDPQSLEDKNIDTEVKSSKEEVLNNVMREEMNKASQAGIPSDLFGTNQHYNIPVNYPDFGRRFVLTYPYVEKKILNDAAEAELDKRVQQYLEAKKATEKDITPVKAPPDFVLQIAKQSALLEGSKPSNPTEDLIQKDILRTGDYWDDVWKEEVNPDVMLRSEKNKVNKFGSFTVDILPGSKLFELISILKPSSPKLLYVVNKNREKYIVFHF